MALAERTPDMLRGIMDALIPVGGFQSDMELGGAPVFVTAILLPKNDQRHLGLPISDTALFADVIGLAIDEQGTILQAIAIPEDDVKRTQGDNGYEIDWEERKRIAMRLLKETEEHESPSA